MLQDRIRQDLTKAMREKDEEKKNTLRMILGEIPRLNKQISEIPTDLEVENIIRKLIKSETQVLELTKKDKSESTYIKILETYLPTNMSETEVKEWIKENINLSSYDNKIKAMGEIMKSLKGKVDGNVVRNILLNQKERT